MRKDVKMAEIIKFKNDFNWIEMIIDLNVGENIPDEIKILLNDMIITYKSKDKRIKKFNYELNKND